MSASNAFIVRPVLTTVCSLLIVIAGLITLPILPIENLPDIAPPTVKVTSRYTGADAVSVEEGVTTVLERPPTLWTRNGPRLLTTTRRRLARTISRRPRQPRSQRHARPR